MGNLDITTSFFDRNRDIAFFLDSKAMLQATWFFPMELYVFARFNNRITYTAGADKKFEPSMMILKNVLPHGMHSISMVS